MDIDLHHHARFSVAPMMDWTDRHCRYFHRLLSREVLLYTEMVTAQAVIHGDRDRLLGMGGAEHPVALQLGGSDPALLARAVRVAADYGYDEINLNVGCPSDRVQAGTFGAVLMEAPDRVAACVAAMREASLVEVTVKCRIGVDDQDPETVLPDFLARVSDAGVTRFAIHARKAWLEGLSPRENRDIPPLDYPLVRRMKSAFPHLHISVNGGIDSLDQAAEHLASGLDGVMIGRAAYHRPAEILLPADARIFGQDATPDIGAVVHAMADYAGAHIAGGGRLHHVTRHMLGLFTGQPGARQWRRILSTGATAADAGPALLIEALGAVLAAGDMAVSA